MIIVVRRAISCQVIVISNNPKSLEKVDTFSWGMIINLVSVHFDCLLLFA